jgi:predicted regulator of amino acid metabolism with ACT domain
MILRERIDKNFEKYPTQRKVVYSLLTYGLKIRNNKIYCGPVEISDSKFARAIGIDRKVVMTTINALKKDPQLKKFFSHLLPTCSLEESAPLIGLGVLEIIPEDPSSPGIIAGVSSILAKEKISIRQAIGNDYSLSTEPRLYIITEEPIPASLLKKIKDVKGIKGISIF